MGKRDRRIDAYIAKSGDFAKPVLEHLRQVVHAACPDVEETIKWGHPAFIRHGLLCNMAAFKEHCTLGFWKGSLILDSQGRRADGGWGQFGRITSLSDLPAKSVLTGYVRKAAKLNEEGVRLPRRPTAKHGPVVVPAALLAALRKNAKARTTFEAFSPGQQRDYAEWIQEAKQEATRARRVATAIEWMSQGKSRNWKYEKRR
jgi:uncharacterized protein YdeI (YjbR/CyaY-like superfamily)